MAYLGKGLNDIATANITVDTMTGDGSDTTLALSWGSGSKGVGSVNDVSVFVSGIQQRPGTDYTLANGMVTFTTAPMNGASVCAIAHGDSWQDNVADSTVVTESFADLAITDAKIIGLDSSKLSGAMPAIDGSALTGITETTNSASDPALDSNGTLGDIWVNTTSGEMYILTDATTDENVWINVGSGTGDVAPIPSYQGEIAGFTAGGHNGGHISAIDRFSFTSDENATDHGDMSITRQSACGQSSTTHGYSSGGNALTDVIDKFTFAGSNVTATDVGNLTFAKDSSCGQSSATHGYVSGGGSAGSNNFIEKFTFAIDANATDVGDLTVGRGECDGTQSTTHGYTCGGGNSNIIDKFTFSSDANATDVGDMIFTGYNSPATASQTHGYCAGGYVGGAGPWVSPIGKFSFSTDGNAVNVGDITVARTNGCSNTSSTHGYTCGGYSGAHSDVIDKFSFTTDGNATDVGNLTSGKYTPAGTQY
jgi:hypothetical protein